MTTAVFGAEYAAAYDLLYHDKDYLAECDLIERVFRGFSDRRVRRVLDLGCGTGGHAAPLVARGYEVVGVDRSAEMLEYAAGREAGLRLHHADIASARLGETFDAVLMMFAVLGYHHSNDEVAAALETVRRHLEPGGIFICDVWYGPAVLAERPSDRVRVTGPESDRIIRTASTRLHTREQACTVDYHLWHLQDGRVRGETREQHRMRFFFPLELELFLANANLQLVRLGGFPNLDDEPGTGSWNAGIVARAV